MSLSQNSDHPFVMIDEIACYAPELAYQNSHYPPESFQALYAAESGSFWFHARQRILEHLIQRYVGDQTATFLEFGCGTGFVLNGLRKFSNLELTGAELHLTGLKYAKQRLPNVPLVQMDATRSPFTDAYHAIGAFDVIEHIDEDVRVLENFYRALHANGLLFLTVPQHPFLWSQTDVLALHKRRYSRTELKTKLDQAGFTIEYISSFVFFLLPAMYISRFFQNVRKPTTAFTACELRLPWVLNRIGSLLMRLEERFIFSGISLPWGGSLVAVARKRSDS